MTTFVTKIVSLGICLVLSSIAMGAEKSEAYRVDAGDVARIEVFGEEDLQKEVTVNDLGEISFPLVGVIDVKGQTTSEIRDLLTEKLKGRFLVNPQLTVSIVRYRKFYISGEVYSPGGYTYQPGLTVRTAISFAGGLKEKASKKKIYVVRENDPDRTPQRVKLGDPVGPGDVITVDQGLF